MFKSDHQDSSEPIKQQNQVEFKLASNDDDDNNLTSSNTSDLNQVMNCEPLMAVAAFHHHHQSDDDLSSLNLNFLFDSDPTTETYTRIVYNNSDDSCLQTPCCGGGGADGFVSIDKKDGSDHNENDIHQQQLVKQDFCIREILSTEENFVDALNTIMSDFLVPLSSVVEEKNRKYVFIDLQQLVELHTRLRDELRRACAVEQAERSMKIFQAFQVQSRLHLVNHTIYCKLLMTISILKIKIKVDLMKEYAVYFSSIDDSLAKCIALTHHQHTLLSLFFDVLPIQDHFKLHEQFRHKLDECRKKSKLGAFKLTELLIMPNQHILRYHLMFDELLKRTSLSSSSQINLIETTKASLKEIGNYLNQCYNDKKNMSLIEKISKHAIHHNHHMSDSNEQHDRKISSSSSNASLNSNNSLNLNLMDYGHYINVNKGIFFNFHEFQ